MLYVELKLFSLMTPLLQSIAWHIVGAQLTSVKLLREQLTWRTAALCSLYLFLKICWKYKILQWGSLTETAGLSHWKGSV